MNEKLFKKLIEKTEIVKIKNNISITEKDEMNIIFNRVNNDFINSLLEDNSMVYSPSRVDHKIGRITFDEPVKKSDNSLKDEHPDDKKGTQDDYNREFNKLNKSANELANEKSRLQHLLSANDNKKTKDDLKETENDINELRDKLRELNRKPEYHGLNKRYAFDNL